MSAPDASQEGQIGTISADVNCVNCGYNLRGLQSDQVCPECGVGIVDTLRDDLLPNCNPAWLATVRAGICILVITNAVGLAGRALAMAAFVPAIRAVGGGIFTVVYGTLSIASETETIATAVGLWLLTSQPAVGQIAMMRLRYGRLLRIIAILGVMASWLRYGYPRVVLADWREILIGVVIIITVFQNAMTLIYLKPLAERALDEKLAKFTDGLLAGTIIVGLMTMGMSCAWLDSLFGRPGIATHVVIALLSLLLSIAWMLVLIKYLRHLDRSIATSSSQWQPRRSGTWPIAGSATSPTATTDTPAPPPPPDPVHR